MLNAMPSLTETTKYRALMELGRGGMASAVLTISAGPGGFKKLQVVKRLLPELASDPEMVQSFLNEARLAARLNHPNIVQTNEVGYDGRYYFIAMEYLDGDSFDYFLRQIQSERRDVPLGIRLRIVCDVLAGLHAAHELRDFDGTPLNVVHRDVSPHNVMITHDGVVKLLDFGIAKAADAGSKTEQGVLKGKIGYMAPERLKGGTVDRRADVFAAGVMLYRAVAGRSLWGALSQVDILARLNSASIPTVEEGGVPFAPELEAIFRRATAPAPEDRFATAADLQNALEEVMRTSGLDGSVRALRELVGELFAERRARVQDLVDVRVRSLVERPEQGPEVPQLSDLLAGTTPRTFTDSQGGMADPTRILASAEAAPRAKRLPSVPIILLVGGLGLIAAMTVLRQNRPSPPSADLSAPSAPAAPTAPAVAEPSSAPPVASATPTGAAVEGLRLTVGATPPEASLFLDGTPLPSNPATVTLPKDGRAHQLRAEARGYVSKQEAVTFDRDEVDAHVTLQKERPSGNPAPATAKPKAPNQPLPPPTVSVPPAKRPPPPDGFDTSDPWANTN